MGGLCSTAASPPPTGKSEATELLHPPRGGMSLLSATAVLATFSTTSSNVMYPWTYAQLGIGLGPLLGLALQGMMLGLSILVSTLAVELRCATFGELGESLGGVWGGRLLRGTQTLNNALFLPVALILSAEALRQVGLTAYGCHGAAGESAACEWWACHVNTVLLLVGLAWPVLLLARDVAHLGAVSLASVVLIVVQGFILVVYASSVAPHGFIAEPYAWFGSSRRIGWADVISALGTYLYSFCPMFLSVEVAAGMQQPKKIGKALVYSFIFNQFMYIPVGIIVVAFWGGAVTDPINLAVSQGASSVICNLILLFCTFLDYAIVGALLNRELQLSLFPAFDRTCSSKNVPAWLMLTAPSLLFSLVMALFVPKLDSLKGLLTSFCVPSAMLFGPAGLLLYRLYFTPASPPSAVSEAITSLHKDNKFILLGGFVLGMGFLIAIFAQTLHNIIFDTNYGGAYFCEQVAGI